MPTGELKAHGGKAAGNGNLHLLDAESLRSHLFCCSQAIIEFRQKLASEINKLQLPLLKVSAGKATGGSVKVKRGGTGM